MVGPLNKLSVCTAKMTSTGLDQNATSNRGHPMGKWKGMMGSTLNWDDSFNHHHVPDMRDFGKEKAKIEAGLITIRLI